MEKFLIKFIDKVEDYGKNWGIYVYKMDYGNEKIWRVPLLKTRQKTQNLTSDHEKIL